MASVVDICNRALGKLGDSAILTLDDDTTASDACKRSYEFIRDAVLRDHPWNFAITRVQLSPLTATPVSEFDYQYQIPGDSLKILEVDTTYDWVVEGRKILTNHGPVIDVRYQKREEDTSQYDSLMIEALAAKVAYELCEELTQSNTKKEALAREYTHALNSARRHDSQESSPNKFVEDDWITIRY